MSSLVSDRRDDLWDALDEELGSAETRTERGRRNKALKELREIGATAEDIRERCAGYRQLWPRITLTATALAANWTLLNGSALKAHDPAGGLTVEQILTLTKGMR